MSGMVDSEEQLVDELLVMKCQDGDAGAMDRLVCCWQKRLWRYAYRLTDSPEAAWEVTQESWLGIIRGLSRLHDPARFRPWAYRIVTNKANDWLRKKAGGRRLQADAAGDEHRPDEQQQADARIDLQDVLHRLSGPSPARAEGHGQVAAARGTK
jgi:RNA polymerase sigma factor (sigma-70 family)